MDGRELGKLGVKRQDEGMLYLELKLYELFEFADPETVQGELCTKVGNIYCLLLYILSSIPR